MTNEDAWNEINRICTEQAALRTRFDEIVKLMRESLDREHNALERLKTQQLQIAARAHQQHLDHQAELARKQAKVDRSDLESRKEDWVLANLKPGDHVKMSGTRDQGYREVVKVEKTKFGYVKLVLKKINENFMTEQAAGKINRVLRDQYWIPVRKLLDT